MTVDRIRGRKLQNIRARWFTRYPLCVACQREGRTRLATQLDHIEPLFRGGKDEDANRQGLCDACHEAKTANDLGYSERVAIGLDGWPVQRAENAQATTPATCTRSPATAPTSGICGQGRPGGRFEISSGPKGNRPRSRFFATPTGGS